MAIRDILLYTENEKALRKKSKSVKNANRKVLSLITDLKDTLQAHTNGVGLAAPQINIHERVVIVCLGAGGEEESKPGPPIALVDPKIIDAGDEQKDFDGCLSFPGLYGETYRPHHLHITGLDENGKPFDRVYEGFDAVVVHHEIDHLDGILFIDRIKDPQDLYTVSKNEHGELVRVPVIAHR